MTNRRESILLVIGSARAGGAEGQLVRLGLELSARNHVVRFIFSELGGSLTDRLDAAGIRWDVARRTDWPDSSTLRRVLGLLNLVRLILLARPTVVMAWLPTAIWPALILGKWLTPATLIAGVRGEIFDDLLGWQRRPLRRAFAYADLVIVNSPHLQEVAKRWGVASDRVRLMPNGVDLPCHVADTTVTPPTGIVVSNYRWYKGHGVLLEALAHVKAPLVVRLCGEGDTADLVARAEALGISSRIVFVPDPADIAAELAQAQFAIHPSTQEGLSNAILEELAAGLPVIAADVGGNPLLVSERTGRLVPASDPVALAAAIDLLAADAELRSVLGRGARAHAREFSWSACVGRYETLFREARSRR